VRRRGGRRAALVRPAGGVARHADGAAGGVERRRVKRLLHVRREVPGRIGVAGVDGAAAGARRAGRRGARDGAGVRPDLGTRDGGEGDVRPDLSTAAEAAAAAGTSVSAVGTDASVDCGLISSEQRALFEKKNLNNVRSKLFMGRSDG